MNATMLALVVAVATIAPPPEQLTYILTPKPSDRTLHVSLRWKTAGRERSTLSVLPNWGGVGSIADQLRGITFGDATGQREGNAWQVEHLRGAEFSCDYDVDVRRDKLTWDATFRPTLTPKFFHGIGTTFLLAPRIGSDDRTDIEAILRWELPAEWKQAACSWGVGPNVGARVNVSDLRHSVYIAGELEVLTETKDGRSVTVAMRDEFAFKVRPFAAMAADIVADQCAFMNDTEFPEYLVTLVPVGDTLPGEASQLSGTGLYQSFAAFAAPRSKMGDALEHLFAHELFHHWNGRILDREAPEEHVYWFSEGLTDYYALRILFESGRWDARTFARWINRHVAEYVRNPAIHATNEDVARGFWTERSTVGEVVYQRGLLLALRWHRLARDHGVADGVDRLFKTLVQRARSDGLRLSNARIRAAGVETLGDWFGPEFDRYVEQVETIEPPLNSLAPALKGVRKTVYEFNPGLDVRKTTAERRVVGLVDGSPAAKAGAKEGDELFGFSIHGDPDRQVELQVKRGGKLVTLKYLPRGKGIEAVQFEPAAATTQPAGRPK